MRCNNNWEKLSSAFDLFAYHFPCQSWVYRGLIGALSNLYWWPTPHLSLHVAHSELVVIDCPPWQSCIFTKHRVYAPVRTCQALVTKVTDTTRWSLKRNVITVVLALLIPVLQGDKSDA